MGAHRIFSSGGFIGVSKGCTFFLKKVDDLSSRRSHNTGHCVTANAQNTLQHFQGASVPLPLAHACGRP